VLQIVLEIDGSVFLNLKEAALYRLTSADYSSGAGGPDTLQTCWWMGARPASDLCIICLHPVHRG